MADSSSEISSCDAETAVTAVSMENEFTSDSQGCEFASLDSDDLTSEEETERNSLSSQEFFAMDTNDETNVDDKTFVLVQDDLTLESDRHRPPVEGDLHKRDNQLGLVEGQEATEHQDEPLHAGDQNESVERSEDQVSVEVYDQPVGSGNDGQETFNLEEQPVETDENGHQEQDVEPAIEVQGTEGLPERRHGAADEDKVNGTRPESEGCHEDGEASKLQGEPSPNGDRNDLDEEPSVKVLPTAARRREDATKLDLEQKLFILDSRISRACTDNPFYRKFPSDDLLRCRLLRFEVPTDGGYSFSMFSPNSLAYPNMEGIFRTSLDRRFWIIEKEWRLSRGFGSGGGRRTARFEDRFSLRPDAEDVFGEEILGFRFPKVTRMTPHPDIPFRIAEETVVGDLSDPFSTTQFILESHEALEETFDMMDEGAYCLNVGELRVKADSLKLRSMNFMAVFPDVLMPNQPKYVCSSRCNAEACSHKLLERSVLRNRVNDHVEDISRQFTFLSREVEKAVVASRMDRCRLPPYRRAEHLDSPTVMFVQDCVWFLHQFVGLLVSWVRFLLGRYSPSGGRG